MKGTRWQNGQIVLTDDLNREQTNKAHSIIERQLDMMTPGVLEDSQVVAPGITRPFQISVGSVATYITVGTGVAIDKTGERILIDSAAPYDITNISLTPAKSSGCVDIPLTAPFTAGKTYQVWIHYLNTGDPDVFTLADGTMLPLYVSGLDGYEITVTEAPIIAPSASSKIELARVTLDVNGEVQTSLISYATRPIAKVKTKRVGLTISGTPPTTYAVGSEVFLDDHTNAVGTGVVTPTNPHGTSANDLGLTLIEGKDHQLKLHTAGVYTTNRASLTTALFMAVYQNSEFNNDRVVIRKLHAAYNESAVVNGITVSPTDIPADTEFAFTSAPEAEGYYLFVLDVSPINGTTTKRVTKLPAVGTFADLNAVSVYMSTMSANYLALGTVKWQAAATPGNPGNYDLIVETLRDLRMFGNVSDANIQPHLIAGIDNGLPVTSGEHNYYNGRVIGAEITDTYLDLNTKTFKITVNSGIEQTLTFTSIVNITRLAAVARINTLTGLYAYLDELNKIRVLAAGAILIGTGTANAVLGFTDGQTDATVTLLKEIVSVGAVPGKCRVTFDAFNRISIIEGMYGNKRTLQTIEYLNEDYSTLVKKVINVVSNF